MGFIQRTTRYAPLEMLLKRGADPLVRTTLSVLTTFPRLYAICMGNHRIIIVMIIIVMIIILLIIISLLLYGGFSYKYY